MPSPEAPNTRARHVGARGWPAVLIIALIMLWPLLIAGRPAYFADTLAYQKGGAAAVNFIASKMAAIAGQAPASAPQPAAASTGATPDPGKPATKAARSITYSVAAYLLRAPGHTMVLVAVVQALSVALIVAGFMWLAGSHDRASAAGFGVAIAFLTPAALVATFIMPDIFAGVLIGAIALLAVAPTHWTMGFRLLLVAVGALAVSVHTSHPPVAFAVTGAAIAMLVLRRGWAGGTGWQAGWIAAPLLVGLLVTTLTGFVGFGEVSMAPKRHPLTLARSIVDGPARLYLEDNCPNRRYAICEVLRTPYPTSIEKILWGEAGIINRATQEQLERIRAEEPEIVWKAALAHPQLQLERIAYNIGRQLLAFDVFYIGFQRSVEADARGVLRFEGRATESSPMLAFVNAASFVTLFCSIAFLLTRWRGASHEERMLVALILAGIIGNAIVCAVFSGVADRYQARVIWLLPLLALSQAVASRKFASHYRAHPAA